jgi:superfamily I DNA/RNA helicase
MTWSEGLEGVHYDIAKDPRSPLHVLAGPGTGKTFAMIRRVARLLEDEVDPRSLLAVSFTRTAAKDIRDQLASLHSPHALDVRASTLHSLSFSILAQAAVFAHTQRHARPLLNYEVRYLEIDLGKAFGGIKRARQLLSAYEAAWARLQTDEPGGPRDDLDVEFHGAVLAWLRYHQAMLVGELVPLTLGFVRQNPALAALPRFAHVLVDEFQDLNKAEQELVALLAAGGALTVIGDDCQSIYSFRHANPEGIRTFPDHHPGTARKTIEECKRCPPNIVAMSNALIAHDPDRTRTVPLKPNAKRLAASVIIVQHETLSAEITTCADYVKHWLARRPKLPHGQVLILAPRRFIGNAIRDELVARGLNATSYFAEDPVYAPSAAEGMCLLTLLVDQSDRAALRAWLGMGSSTGLAGGYARLRQESEHRREQPTAVLARLSAGEISIPHTDAIVSRWNLLQDRLHAIGNLRGLELVRAIWPVDDEDADDIRLMAEEIALNVEDPQQILESLRQDVTQPYLPDAKGDVLRVMSLHKSKGLTAELVVIVGAMAGAIPHVDSKLSAPEKAAQLAEQRRLFYVAITRTSDTLVISGAASLPFSQAMQGQITVVRQRRKGAQTYAVTAMSPFIAELGRQAPRVIRGVQWREAAGF